MTYRKIAHALLIFLCLCSWIPLIAGAAPQAVPTKKTALQGGVGLQVVPISSGEIVIIAVLASSPADKAKLRPGDLIIAVDDVALRGSKFSDVTKNRLWGKAGTKVKLTWQRPGVAGKKSVQLLRAALKDEPQQDLEVQMLVPNVPPVSEGVKP